MRASTAQPLNGVPSARVAWGHGETATVLRDEDVPSIEIVGPANTINRHQMTYVLGHEHIEQPLVPFPRGRLQALPIGFDPVRREWFDIFAHDPRRPGELGHWTNRGMTANTACLPCHTTGLEKGYHLDTDSYTTRWAEAALGCEGCHGPGAMHARLRSEGEDATRDPYGRPVASTAMDACASCHALRREVLAGFEPGAPFLDFFEPLLLDGDDYYPDGQVHSEAYEWTSFLQSRMAQAGVTCLDCHDAHAGRVKAPGNALCLGCHDAQLDTPAHTHHPPASAGAACVACHMPVTVFMERDPRHDHSFALPDPQTTVELGIPNACGRCHGSESAAWAAARVTEWYGESEIRRVRRAMASAFTRARRGDPTTIGLLNDCLRDCDRVRRASAARVLAKFTGEPDVLDGLLDAAAGEDALIRANAVWALAEEPAPDARTLARLREATTDPVRLVRLNAAWGLRRHPSGGLPQEARRLVEQALDEWRAAMGTQTEHPETHHTLGVFHADRGEVADAERSYRTALRLAPDAVPSRYNLAMLLGREGKRLEAEEEFLEVRQLEPGFAPAAHALGLLYGEAGQWREAVTELTDCLKSDPLYPGALTDLAHAYVQLGQGEVANTVLEAAARYPGAGTEALRALVAVNLELGDRERARRWAREASDLGEALAADPRVVELLRP